MTKRSNISFTHQVRRNIKNLWQVKNLAILLTVAAIISAIATYWSITHSSSPFGPDPKTVLPLILINLVLLLAIAIIVISKFARLWTARKKGSVGSRLQTRIILMFSLVAIVPTIIVATFSTLFFNYGIQSWFDERVGTALEESVAVAEGYLKEHKENIKSDALSMANDLNRQSHKLMKNPNRFKHFVSTQASLRELTEAIVFKQSDILAKSDLTFSLLFEIEKIPSDVFKRAILGEVVIITNENDDRVRALIKLNNFLDAYLLVGRFVDRKVLMHMERTKGSVNEYQILKANISSLQIQFSFIFLAVALLLLLAALWIGLIFTGEIITPISSLISATQKVRAGKLDTRVKDGPRNDEIATLGKAFNRMTDQLQKQRNELIAVNKQIDERRRFTEAVLSGVSAGIIALDKNKKITLFNRSAPILIKTTPSKIKNKLFKTILPEVEHLFDDSAIGTENISQKEITITRDGRSYTFLFRIVEEKFSDEVKGYIVTFDDITELLTAQRSAAWKDVARRIAHEIKNPLTPIHLATDRIKSKYIDEISDKKTFARYIDTINRHITNIGNIVEEFVSFARMPTAKLSSNNLYTIVKDSVFSEKVVNSEINYDIKSENNDIIINCDPEQLSQVMINLLKNSSESIQSSEKEGELTIYIQETDKSTKVIIEDNGIGFPEELLDRITEPYITTKKTGTGLGLAIVNKVINDHDGNIFVENIKDRNKEITGARVTLSFPRFFYS